jgi:hypothetical protein
LCLGGGGGGGGAGGGGVREAVKIKNTSPSPIILRSFSPVLVACSWPFGVSEMRQSGTLSRILRSQCPSILTI